LVCFPPTPTSERRKKEEKKTMYIRHNDTTKEKTIGNFNTLEFGSLLNYKVNS
jgi:hypothetical protein